MSNGINIDLTANLARWTSSLDRATQDLSRFQTNAQRISGTIGSIFSGLGVGIGVGAFAGIIKGSIDTADSLKDLSKSTGITVEQLTGLKLAADKSGTNLEDTATAINKLSVNIGKSGDKFRQLGIDAKDPLQAFAQLADVFNGIEDPQKRAALAAAALGKAWQTTAPLLAEGGDSIRQMVADGQKFSGITSQMANEADAFNDSLSNLKARLAGVAVSLVGPVLDGFTQLLHKIDEASGAVKTFNSVLTGIGNFAFNSDGIRGLSVEIDNINSKIVSQKDKINKLKDGGGIFSLLSNDDINLERNKLDQLIKQRDAAVIELQKSRVKITAPVTPSTQAVNNFIGVKDSTISKAQSVRSIPKEDKLSESDLAIYKEFDSILEEGDRIALSQRNSLFDVTKQASLLKAELADFTPPASGEFEQRLYRIDDALKQGVLSANEAKQAYDNLGKAFNAGSFDDSTFTKQKDQITKLSEFAVQGARNLETSLANSLKTGFQDGLDGMLKSFLNFLSDAAANAAASQLLEILGGAAKSGTFGTVIKGLVSGISGARASGGPVSAGNTFLVGEKGPELFTPSNNGTILPAGSFGGKSGSNVYNVGISVQQNSNDSPDKTGQKIAEAFIRSLAKEEINNANRPGNVLNKVTNFG